MTKGEENDFEWEEGGEIIKSREQKQGKENKI